MELKLAASEFLKQKRIAVVGYSRNPAETANAIFKKFQDNGYEVFAVNPAVERVDGVTCYASVKDIPGGVGAAMLVTTPEVSSIVARDCVESGVKWVWMHRSFGDSVSAEAAQYLRGNHVGVIPGGCPMMFLDADPAHKAMCWMLQLVGRVPRAV
ncbi:MAG: CoA-binding protein [Anaerolineae bacterium]|nr:MAG: CoA-binding protein [Anaerolineae bacterium]